MTDTGRNDHPDPLTLHWTRVVGPETEPLDQRGAILRNNNTGVRNLRWRAYANPIDKQGTAPAAAVMACKQNLVDQMHAGKTTKVGPGQSMATAPARRIGRASAAHGRRGPRHHGDKDSRGRAVGERGTARWRVGPRDHSPSRGRGQGPAQAHGYGPGLWRLRRPRIARQI